MRGHPTVKVSFRPKGKEEPPEEEGVAAYMTQAH